MNVPSTAIELTCYYTWMGDDGIAYTKIKKGAEVTLPTAIENSKAVNSLYRGKKFPLFIDSRGIRSITSEARNQFSVKDRETHTLAFAIVIDSSISKVVGNFFMGINKPAVPTRLFTSEEEAIAWLKNYIQP